MTFNFNALNRIRTWAFEPDYNTSDADNYRKLSEIYEDSDTEYLVRGCFLNPKTNFKSKVTGKKEAAVIMLDDFMINVPDHQIGAITSILDSEEACTAIDNEELYVKIREYHQNEYDKDCYSLVFVHHEE